MLLLAPLLVSCGGAPESRNMTAGEVAGELGSLRITPGLWQVSSRIVDVRGPNLPIAVRRRMIGPRGSVRHCISAEQAAQPSAGFLAGRGDGGCSHRDFSMQDGRLRGAMTCAGDAPGAPVETVMDGRYGPDRYDLRMEMRNPMPDGTVMTIEVMNQGRRIGPCEGREQ
jgi:hypothetical protein